MKPKLLLDGHIYIHTDCGRVLNTECVSDPSIGKLLFRAALKVRLGWCLSTALEMDNLDCQCTFQKIHTLSTGGARSRGRMPSLVGDSAQVLGVLNWSLTRIRNLPLLLQCCRQDISTVAVCGTELWVVYGRGEASNVCKHSWMRPTQRIHSRPCMHTVKKELS